MTHPASPPAPWEPLPCSCSWKDAGSSYKLSGSWSHPPSWRRTPPRPPRQQTETRQQNRIKLSIFWFSYQILLFLNNLLYYIHILNQFLSFSFFIVILVTVLAILCIYLLVFITNLGLVGFLFWKKLILLFNRLTLQNVYVYVYVYIIYIYIYIYIFIK